MMPDFERERRERAMERYRDALRDVPPPHGGQTHSWMMRTANLAARAGVDAGRAERDILDALGTRAGEKRGEVRVALSKAYREAGTRAGDFGPMSPLRSAKPRKAPRTFAAYVEAGIDFHEGDCWEASPVHFDWPPGWEDAVAFLRNLFLPDDWVCCVYHKRELAIWGQSVRWRDQWIEEIERLGREGKPLPLRIMVNPLSHVPTPRKGQRLFRGDSAVAAFRNLVAEADGFSLPLQLAFWGGFGKIHGWERVRALIHTGGKSIHGILRMDVGGFEDWKRCVPGLVKDIFGAMEFDSQNQNPSRFTRLPGAVRRDEPPDTDKWAGNLQRLLLLGEEIR